MKKVVKNRLTAGFLAVTCMSVLLTGCGRQEEETVLSDAVPVEVMAPQAGELSLKNEFVGTVSPEEAVYVMPMVSAEVLSTNVSVGDRVQAGDVLCRLDSEAAELQLQSAQASYSSAQAGLNSAQAGYNSAVAGYASTEAQLDAQLGGTKKLQDYQTENQIKKIKDGIEDLDENLNDIEDDKDDLKKARNKAEKQKDEAAQAVTDAKNGLEAAKAKLAELKASTTVSGAEGAATAEEIALAEEKVKTAEADVKSAEAAAQAASAAYNTLKNQYETLKDSIEDLEDSKEDAEESLEQAQTASQITQEDVYGDVRKQIDAGKAAAKTSIDSAQAGVESARVGLEAAQVGIDSAQYQLDMYTITAPIDGIIESVGLEEHGFATPSSPAFVISNKETMTVTFYVSEGIRNTFQIGESIQVERGSSLYEGTITEIGSMVDQTTGLFQIKASVSAPDNGLLTGSSVKIVADTYSRNDALLIPYDAVYFEDSQAYVYVAENGKAVRKDIETDIFDETTITVVSGLTASDQVIVTWSSNLRDGAEITVQGADSTATEEDTKEQAEKNGETQTEAAE
ncbi:MAG: efflux RND transporter periplasmic adaptor subunit [Lachnospiraceae bacterium]|nr:efflux RND transporter periplasmic adaptor subunit [Lachnospiraceae bacterium]